MEIISLADQEFVFTSLNFKTKIYPRATGYKFNILFIFGKPSRILVTPEENDTDYMGTEMTKGHWISCIC